jgi:WD40 repeat protein
LNTKVEAPHFGSVLGMAFHPTENMLVTCGNDGKFKVWIKVKVETDRRDGEFPLLVRFDASSHENGSLLGLQICWSLQEYARTSVRIFFGRLCIGCCVRSGWCFGQ